MDPIATVREFRLEIAAAVATVVLITVIQRCEEHRSKECRADPHLELLFKSREMETSIWIRR